MAFPAEARRVVDADREEQRRIPPKNARANEPVERCEEGKLRDGNLPLQSGELLAGAARPEHVRSFSRIQLIGFCVGKVVHAIKQQTQGKQDEKQAEPESRRVQKVT